MRKSFVSAVLVTVVAAAMNLTALTGPAAAATCDTPNCGGEVDNNTNAYLSISNCWADSYGTWENGDNLPCHGNPVRVGNMRNARVWLSPGQREDNYSYFYDTDAVRFPKDCKTYYHWWGQSREANSEDRRGKDAIWRKISSADHFYFDRVVC
ncbi:hypothetical protein [Streptomyces scabiei]|uniref:Secreted protein n=1 Tax=Streptomyces scabiei TaxID=1930 RepID=A0A117EDP2_STRSC|nr:hypothetical protein [Streptomyces scabiei]GAQ62332.1 hypothetical protein SsS58_02697 [Streptomyces scabiei]